MARRLNTKNMLTVGSVAVLVGIEILAAAFALGWAVGGLLELGSMAQIGVIGLCVALGSWATVAFVRAAVKVEPILEGRPDRP